MVPKHKKETGQKSPEKRKNVDETKGKTASTQAPSPEDETNETTEERLKKVHEFDKVMERHGLF